jgi:hypothetical protein
MSARSYESAWLDYEADNKRARKAYRRRMVRLRRAYAARMARAARHVASEVTRCIG